MISPDDYIKYSKKRKQEREEFKKELQEIRKKELAEKGLELIEPQKKTDEEPYGDCDSIYTMENSTATVLYVVVMLVGTIFKDRIYVYIMATAIWLAHINRHQIRRMRR